MQLPITVTRQFVFLENDRDRGRTSQKAKSKPKRVSALSEITFLIRKKIILMVNDPVGKLILDKCSFVRVHAKFYSLI